MKAQVRKPAPKAMIIIARYFIKSTKSVVYSIRPSKAGEVPYCTTIINGRATGCTCPSRTTYKRYAACKHMEHCQALELARTTTVGETYTQAVATVVEQAVVGANHEVQLSGFYGVRGAEIVTAKVTPKSITERMDAAPLNNRNGGFSLMAKSL